MSGLARDLGTSVCKGFDALGVAACVDNTTTVAYGYGVLILVAIAISAFAMTRWA